MMMTGIMALAAGIGLGFFYFGGLWLSVRRLVQTPRRPALAWLGASRAVRFATLGVALSLLARGGAGLLLGALVGLWLARTYLVCRLGGVLDAP
jgi:F1F0 ATPase subunit 2